MKPSLEQARRDLENINEGYANLGESFDIDFDTIKDTFQVKDLTNNLELTGAEQTGETLKQKYGLE